MTDSRTRIHQGLWLLLAAGLAVCAGLLQPRLNRLSEEGGLVPPGNPAAKQDPTTALLTVLPGGLRAPILGWLWIEAEDLKIQGRNHDALQKTQLICALQPYFSGAWAFQAWNMAYNISVQYHTGEHRWLWVYNGIKLLRDQGIPNNPWSISLYEQLAWTYFHKVGQFLDDFHEFYKRRWAAYMQHLLAPPAFGTTEEVIAAFRPIAAAPLDRDPARQGKPLIQPDQRELVLRDGDCAEYARLLGQQGVAVDASLLDAYNRYSQDEAIRLTWTVPRRPPAAGRPAAVAALINAPRHAAARGKLLAFVRAQLLWNEYRMDPRWMLGLMEKYGPLDWRLPWSHAVYWATYGFHAAQGTPLESLENIQALNAGRYILFGLKDLTWQGRAAIEEDPNRPDLPALYLTFDPRFVEPAQREYARLIQKARKDRSTETVEDNAFRSGHMNYLATAIEMLYACYRHDEARKYLQVLKDTYHFKGGEWDMELEDFVVTRLASDASPSRETAMAVIPAAIQSVYLRTLEGDASGARTMSRLAQRAHARYQEAVPDRNRLPPLPEIERLAVQGLLIRPLASGYNLSLLDRARLWRITDPRLQAPIYPALETVLRPQCQAEGVDFDVAFPAPR
jgi:hypothetical protein